MIKADLHPAIHDCYLDHPYALAGRVIDPVTGNVSWQGKLVHLQRKDLEVLALLTSVNGAVVSRASFIAVVWDGNDLVGDRGVSDKMFSLRRALADHDEAQPIIRTIPRRGYQLSVAAVQPITLEQPAFAPGKAISGCPGWHLQRQLTTSEATESWLAHSDDKQTAPRVFSFCCSEAHLRGLQRETTLLRYLSESLGERKDFALIRDWQLDEPPYYLARDYTAFGTLSQWRGLADAPVAQRMAMMQGLCDAVAAMHALGVVHRQLSVETILVDSAESGPQLKISAFDLGALNDRSALAPLKITAAGLTVGTEEHGTELTAADDVLALGTVLLQLMLGDLQAQPGAEYLGKVPNPQVQALLSHCFGPANARPSAGELAAQLRVIVTPETAPVAAIASTAEAAKTPAAVPKLSTTPTISNYHLLERLGEGGMGTVYLAELRAPVYRKVALKIIRSGLDGKQILSRFDAERQALAMMNHPNVAAVHESGMADDGRPFFAMEYIAGDDINSYCDAHHLNLPARIKLFLQVCDGVLHAHQKGVLHRDIKPSNLMVSGAPGNAGTVKVIDFGLAKSLHGKLAAHTLHTSFGAFIGTPIYSSPEHVLGAAAGVDTRSDIYSMGVVLYELLAGMTPIASESLENLEPEKVRELVCNSKLPSMREQLQKTSAEKRAAIAEQRAIKLDDLPKTLEGDLSWVVSKCLERDPNDRYASVLELRKDLERWLQLRPVEARPTSSWYRFRKLLRRNRSTSTAIAASILLLLLTTTAAIVGFIRSERALEQSRVAVKEADVIAEFQVKQIQSIDPAIMGNNLRNGLLEAVQKHQADQGASAKRIARELKQLEQLNFSINFTDLALQQVQANSLTPSASVIEKDFAAHPLLQARLWQSLADTQRKLGLFEAAVVPQNRALELREKVLGKSDLLTLISARSLGLLQRDQGQLPQALSGLERVHSAMQALIGNEHPETLKTAAEICVILMRQGKLKEALALQLETLLAQRKTLGEDHIDVLHSLDQYTFMLIMSGQHEQGLQFAQETLALSQKLLGDDKPETLAATSRLAQANWALGNMPQAVSLMRNNVAAYQRTLGNSHPNTLGAMGNLATVLTKSNKPDEAEGYVRAALKSMEQLNGSNTRDIEKANSVLGHVLLTQGRYADCEVLARQFLAQHGQSKAENGTQQMLVMLAEILRFQGKPAEAEVYLRKLYAARESLGPTDQHSLIISVKLAGALREKGDLDSGESLLKSLGQTNNDEVNALINGELGTLAMARGQLEAAEKLLRVAFSKRNDITISLQQRLDTTLVFEQLLRTQGKLDEALEVGKELIEVSASKIYAKHSRLGDYFTEHGKTLLAAGKTQDAEAMFERARRNYLGSNNPVRGAVEALIRAYIQLYESTNLPDSVRDWQARLLRLENAQNQGVSVLGDTP